MAGTHTRPSRGQFAMGTRRARHSFSGSSLSPHSGATRAPLARHFGATWAPFGHRSCAARAPCSSHGGGGQAGVRAPPPGIALRRPVMPTSDSPSPPWRTWARHRDLTNKQQAHEARGAVAGPISAHHAGDARPQRCLVGATRTWPAEGLHQRCVDSATRAGGNTCQALNVGDRTSAGAEVDHRLARSPAPPRLYTTSPI